MRKGLIILSMFFVLVLAGIVYATCSTSDDYTLDIIDPLGVPLAVNPYSCTDIVLYTAANRQSCPSTSGCSISFVPTSDCQMQGDYEGRCTGSGLCPANQIIYCDYDDCPACCTTSTSYVWRGWGGQDNCCGDDAATDLFSFFDCQVSSCDDVTNERCIGLSDDATNQACCLTSEECVNLAGSCVAEYSMVDYDSDTVVGEICSAGQWTDCDRGEWLCGTNCGFDWAQGGESSSFGEYDSGTSTECCGDDAGEYYAFLGIGAPGCCNTANNCIDLSGNCVLRNTESIANVNCQDTVDNDCDGECDYDSTTCTKGDNECQVGVTNIAVSDSTPWDNSAITVDCTSTVAGVNSIEAQVDGVGSCSFTGWAGNVASFSCNVGSANCPVSASKIVRCGIDTAKSYQSGSDQTTSIDVQCSDCSTMTDQTSCETIPTCEWCPECGGAGNRMWNGGDVCVALGNCPAYACSLGVCDAACDGNVGGCGATSCDTTTCLCNPDISCNPDTYGSADCCNNSLGLEPDQDTDNVVGDFAINCAGASCYGESFPFSEVLSVYDDSCCGDDSGEFFNYFNLHVDNCDDITVEECIGAVDDTTDRLCCNNAGDCVYNNQCLPAGTGPLDLDNDSVQGEYCSNSGSGTWIDCDVSQPSCESPSCGNRTWTNADWESPFGEYENIVDVECCGDDAGEYIRYRQVKSTSDGDGAINVYTDPTDIACCPSPDACVYNGVCYMDYDVAVVEINLTCAGLTKIDCQTTENCQWHKDCIGETPQYNDLCKTYDDINRMTHQDNMVMCTVVNNCQILEECRVMEWEINERPNLFDSTYKDKVYKDINLDGNREICDPGEWIDPNTDKDTCESIGGFWLGTACCGDIDPDPDCDGTFYGNVKDIDGVNVENVVIDLIGTSPMFPGTSLNYTTTTDVSGDYNVDVTGNATYDLIASKSYFNSETVINQFVEMGLSKEVNFTLVSSYEQCEADCTFVDDEFCHAGCDGRVGCLFYTDGTKAICNGVMLGWSVDYNSTHEVICCEGQPYVNPELRVVSVDLDDNVETMIRLIRLVVLRGKPTRLIIDAFK